MDRVRLDLASFYDDEARSGRRGPAAGRRVRWLDEFVGLLIDEGRRNVIDVGAGPGTDAAAFLSAGLGYTGIDLAPANGVLAMERGATVIGASLFDLPFSDARFDAGWSMSTLMHVPAVEVDRALGSMCRTLAPGSPLMIGQWGGALGSIRSDRDPPGMQRLFDLRSADANRGLLERFGRIERWEVWDEGADGWEYHAAVVRIPG